MRKFLTMVKNFFLDHINWCHPTLSNGQEKQFTKWYQLYCWLFWPIPWMEEPCWCCASFRGIMCGILLGVLGSYLWRIFI